MKGLRKSARSAPWLCRCLCEPAGSAGRPGLAALVWWLLQLFVTRERKAAWRPFAAGVACALAAAAILPFFLRLFGGKDDALAGVTKKALGPAGILNDAASKLLLGDQLWASVLAWLVFVAGTVGLFLRHPDGRRRGAARCGGL